MTPALESQEEASRLSRAHLAFRRCVCGRCAEADVIQCDHCTRFRPRCLAVPVSDSEGGQWMRCAEKCEPLTFVRRQS